MKRTLWAITPLFMLFSLATYGTVCTKTVDTARFTHENVILNQFTGVYVNGNSPWDSIKFDVETTREDVLEETADDRRAYLYLTKTHRDNPSWYSRINYRRRFEYSHSRDAPYGYKQSYETEVCGPAEDLLFRNTTNEVARVPINYGKYLGGDWKNKGTYTFKASIKYWSGEQEFCNLSFGPKELPGAFGCDTHRFEVPEALFPPEEQTERQKVRAELDALIERAKGVNSDFKDKLEKADRALKEIEGLGLFEIEAHHLEDAGISMRTVTSLRKEFSELIAERESLRDEFNRTWEETSHELDEVIRQLGVTTSDFDTSFALNIHESTIDLSQLGLGAEPAITAYLQYARETKAKLKNLELQGESLAFISETKLWLDTAKNLESILADKEVTAPDEWRALVSTFQDVEQYIFSVVDRDFWFKDSPVTEENKRSLRKIKSLSHGMALLMEADLRGYRRRDMTNEKREVLTMLDLIGNSIDEDSVASEYHETLNGLAAAIAEGAVCAAKVVVSGDFGDLYEVSFGKDLCSGENLTIPERLISSLGFVVGNGRAWRRAAEKSGLTTEAKYVFDLSSSIKASGRKMGMDDAQLKEFAGRMAELYPCAK